MQVEFDRCMDQIYWPLSRRGYTDVAVDKALIEAFGFLQSSDPPASVEAGLGTGEGMGPGSDPE